MATKLKKAQISSTTVAIIIAVSFLVMVLSILHIINPNFIYRILPNYDKQVYQDEDFPADNLASGSPCNSDEIPVSILSAKQDGKIWILKKEITHSLLENPSTSISERNYELTELIYDKQADFNAILKIKRNQVGQTRSNIVFITRNYLDENDRVHIDCPLFNNCLGVSAIQLALIDSSRYDSNFFCKKNSSLVDSSNYIPPWPYKLENGQLTANLITFPNNELPVITTSENKQRLVLDPYITAKESEEFIYIQLYQRFVFNRQEKKIILKTYPTNYLVGEIDLDGFVWVTPQDGNPWNHLNFNFNIFESNRLNIKIILDKKIKTNIKLDYNALYNLVSS